MRISQAAQAIVQDTTGRCVSKGQWQTALRHAEVGTIYRVGQSYKVSVPSKSYPGTFHRFDVDTSCDCEHAAKGLMCSHQIAGDLLLVQQLMNEREAFAARQAAQVQPVRAFEGAEGLEALFAGA